MNTGGVTAGGRRGALAIICVLALVARLWVAVQFPNEIHPDETFQYLEQAYRVVTGRGMVPWEYIVGARSWIIPGLLVPVIAGVRLLSSSPDATLFAIATFASLLSLAIVVAAYVLGRRVGGEAAGLAAGLVVALWPEIVMMSPHVLADTIGAIPLIAAVAVGYRPGERTSIGRGAMATTGLLLCAAAVLRPQLIPAAAVAALWIARLEPRRYGALIAGAIPVLVVFALVDWLTWGAPFASIVRYIAANRSGIAAQFGVQPFTFYARQELLTWRLGTLVVGITALVGMRRLPLLGAVSLAVLLTFSCIGHKEERFIYPALPLLFTLCGVGTVEIVRWFVRSFGERRRAAVTIGLAAAWLASGTVAVAALPFTDGLHRNEGVLATIRAINADPGVCGVAVVPGRQWHNAGTIRFRDDVHLYAPSQPVEASPAYNTLLLIGEPSAMVERGGFRLVSCDRRGSVACLLRRRSRCDGVRGLPLRADMNPVVEALLRRTSLLPGN